jgi:hypothetical protein
MRPEIVDERFELVGLLGRGSLTHQPDPQERTGGSA